MRKCVGHVKLTIAVAIRGPALAVARVACHGALSKTSKCAEEMEDGTHRVNGVKRFPCKAYATVVSAVVYAPGFENERDTRVLVLVLAQAPGWLDELLSRIRWKLGYRLKQKRWTAQCVTLDVVSVGIEDMRPRLVGVAKGVDRG